MVLRAWTKIVVLTASTYFKFPSIPVEPLTALSLLWLPFLVRSHGRELLSTAIAPAIAVLGAAQLLSVLWSVQKLEAVRDSSLTFAVLTSYLAFCSLGQKRLLNKAMSFTAPLMIVAAGSIVVFQLWPALELAYLRSGLAGLLIGSEAPQLFQGRPNNVLLEERAGGLFFVNSNRASMVLGLHAMVYAAISYQSSRSGRWRLLAVFTLVGVMMTGSKTGLVLGLILPLACLFFSVPRSWRFPVCILGTLAGCGATLIAAQTPLFTAPDATIYADSWQDRLPMWSAAGSFLTGSLFLGLGFGGWAEEWGKVFWSYGKPPSFPPHNVLIANWTDSGMIAAGATLVIGLGAFLTLLRKFRAAERPEVLEYVAVSQNASALWASGAIVWAFVHSLGDNTYFFGVPMNLAAYGCAMYLVRHERRGVVPGTVAQGSSNTIQRMANRGSSRRSSRHSSDV